MEALKGVVYKRGKVGTKNMYLICVNVLTDREITGLAGNETIVMSENRFVSPVTDAVEGAMKFKPPFQLGTIDLGVMHACEMKPDQLRLVGSVEPWESEDALESDDDYAKREAKRTKPVVAKNSLASAARAISAKTQKKKGT